MVKNRNDILVNIINKVEGAEQLMKEGKLIRELKKDNGDLSRTYEDQTASQRKRMTVTESTTAAGKKQVTVNNETLAQGPRFQMHYLGIMFGGMALNRAMANLTATSKEWVGMGEIMSTTMGVVMLPATLALLETAIIPLSDTLLNLPPEIQTVIGVTVLGLEGLGKIAEFGGQIALGAAAFKIAFPALADKITAGLTSRLGKGIGKGVGIAVGLSIAWASIDFIRAGIDEGSLQKEILGVLGFATGFGTTGWMLAGPVGGLIGFTLGIGVGLIIDWSIKENKWQEAAKDLGVSGETMGAHLATDNIVTRFITSLFGGGMSDSEKVKMETDFVNFAISGEKIRGFAVGGNVSNSGLHFLHEGETVLRKDQTNNMAGNVSVVYNVNVSDKREFEQMLKNNNAQLVREVRRNSIT